ATVVGLADFLPSRSAPAQNPFRTSVVSSLSYVDTLQHKAALSARLIRNEVRAAVIGPCGCGKTTLLEALERDARDNQLKLFPIRLTQSQKKVSASQWLQLVRLAPQTIVTVDGFEQLPFLQRRLFILLCRRVRSIIVTSHTPVALPLQIKIAVTAELFIDLVAQIAQKPIPLETHHALQQLFISLHGNIRDCFMALYDLCAGIEDSTMLNRSSV
ncbi:MAG: hypothetical protein JW795_11220, partial [Chitinivibrionales bacterium]|nr:hypothetical protein [Chitinivibrionales bacterium]